MANGRRLARAIRAPKDPRKAAVQARSRMTVDAIFEAMNRVLAEDGIHAFSVTEVARVAGVGKASIYDYFPTREALVSAWEERTIAVEMTKVGARVAEILQSPPHFEASAVELVTMVVDAFAHHARKYHYRERFDLRAKSAVRESQAEHAVAMMKAGLAMGPSRARYRAMDLEVAARLIIHSVLGLSYALAVTSLTDEERADHARELARMICGYVLQDADPQAFVKPDRA
jgi:AcrR family transcriptional regulator